MKAEAILTALGDIDDRLVEEARESRKVNSVHWRKWGLAVACFCLLFLGIRFLLPSGGTTVTAYAIGTGQELTVAGAVLETGQIRDGGEMTGHPLRFYLAGENIDHVRFSCKNEQIDFVDWTEQREEYGSAQNFTVHYGTDENEYRSLVIEWVPNRMIETLTNSPQHKIVDLPAELREDRIVMEITFADGKTEVKAISISLMEDGTFFAAYDDYTLTAEDTFVQRPDAQVIPRDELYGKPDECESAVQVPPEAEQVARAYYAETVFEVVSIHPVSVTEQEIICEVCVCKNSVIQEPYRRITLQRSGNVWKVVNEGY